MKRPWQVWVVFGVSLAAIFAAMGWLTVVALRLDRAETRGRRIAAVEESVRLSLWRMESAIAPILAAENARPYFTYSSFYPAQRAYNNMFAPFQPGEVYVPSPLLVFKSPYIRVHFQIGPDGRITSPQVPTGNMRDNAESSYLAGEEIDAFAAELAALSPALDRGRLLARLPREAEHPLPAFDAPQITMQTEQDAPEQQQLARSMQEMQARNRVSSTGSSYLPNASNDFKSVLQKEDGAPSAVAEGAMRPVWLGDRLVLARRVGVNGDCYVQGCELDWAAIRSWLLGEVRDLLPEARLESLTRPPGDDETRLLASIPAKLVPGEVPVAETRTASPMALTLAIAWFCLVLVAFAVGTLLVGTVSLSERRATFVSAVTHELRTPITTLRMYSEMLDEGMVTDDARRGEYVRTLRSEAERLGHLIENVLGYSRLERGRHVKRMESTTASDLIRRMEKRLADRARKDDMSLHSRIDPGAAEAALRTDPSVVEQILFNLIDNACKYARGAEDRRIHLDVAGADGRVTIRVSDHGPGVSPEMRNRLFRPFSKSAKEAAHSAPGIGMGLALSRRLARDLGGELRLDGSSSLGARFTLTLPCE